MLSDKLRYLYGPDTENYMLKRITWHIYG